MAKNDVKLIGAWPSPFVLRARIALNVKSVEYEFLQEEFLQETLGTKSELLLKSNPVHKKFPVLIHNDKPIRESLIIVEYIDEALVSDQSPSDQSILPSEPYDRAIARLWAAYIDEKWFPALEGMAATGKGVEKRARKQVEEGLALLEKEFQEISKGKNFFGGDHIGYLDIAFGGLLRWLRAIEGMDGIKLINETKTPGLLKWAEKFAVDPAVKDVLPEIEELTEFTKAK